MISADDTDTGTGNVTDTVTDTVIANDGDTGTISDQLQDAPTSFIRIIQYADANGAFETLRSDEVWYTELDDWAILLNGAPEPSVEEYGPWGEVRVLGYGAVVFRTGQLVGVTDENDSEFFETVSKSEEVLFIDAIEDRLDEQEYPYGQTAPEGDA